MVTIPSAKKALRRSVRVTAGQSKRDTPEKSDRTYSRAADTPAPSGEDDADVIDAITVRRPGYGVFPQKPNWATLEVISMEDKKPIEIFNSCYKGGAGPGTTNFIMQGMRWAPSEATQVIRSYGDWYLSDIGEEPDILMVSGVLLESANFPWFREWMANWEQYLRARRCIINRTTINLTIDNVTWRGYMMQCEVNRTHSFQSSWMVLPITFQIVLRDVVDNTETDAVRVGPGKVGQDEDPVIDFYKNQLVPGDESFTSAAPIVGSAIDAYEFELLQGDGVDPLILQEPALSYPKRDEELVYELNIARLTAIAAATNAETGRQVFDLGAVRRGLIATQNSALSARGLNDPYGSPGNQNRYRDKTSRQIENGIDTALTKAGRAAKDFLF